MGAQDRLVGQRYRLGRRVGSGASGTVWQAYDEVADREVAVKRPRLPGGPADETYRRAAHRLYREARAAARVDHPAAVRIHDVVVEEAGPDGLPWIVMEWVRGESLREALRRGPVAAPEAARIGLAVLGALRAAHSVGIVHRGVKPANVLLGPHGRVVLTGFGTDHVPGEEPLRGAGPAADLRSLGVLLHAATAEHATTAAGRTTIAEPAGPVERTAAEQAATATERATTAAEGSAAGPLGPLIERLLAKDSGRRPEAEQFAEEIAEELAAVVGDRRRGPGPAPDRKEVIGFNPST
ncbi:serine/threonine protein kinase [Streptomyces pactum]|uniref:non-specific serine/threonine protein kinase n=1 Tax=Streptomyces pactum TaxID=68249 RepID=A0A1S6J8B2_9ACTN|nr:serine/threonine-protein kinase [Streptomyces pactum]AQS67994.1 serine/threonine protein kinase [Streptomyces pactum]